MNRNIILIFLVLLMVRCTQPKPEALFTKMDKDETGVAFNNQLKENDSTFNILFYPYFYNGAGVGVGDINNDGLPDIVFAGNQVSNTLYLNKGNFKFEDISKSSGVDRNSGWSTGITFVDINQDGWQDIYICKSGLPKQNDRKIYYSSTTKT